MLRDNANTNELERSENNFQQHVGSIRQLKNKLFTDEIAISPKARQTENELTEGKSVERINGYSISL